jgi:hypothetical protein
MWDVKVVAVFFIVCVLLWRFARRRPLSELRPNVGRPPGREIHLQRETMSMISPVHQHDAGWPAVAIEMFPPLGVVRVEDYGIVEHVSATYMGPELPDLTLEQDVPDGADVVLASMQDEVTSSCPTPRCKAVFEISDSVLTRAREGLPPGYNPVAKTVTVFIGIDIRGTRDNQG